MTVRAALETALNAMTPAVATAWENDKYKPVPGTPYQKASLLMADPENPEMGGAGFREVGIFQILLRYPLGAGPSAADARADLIRAAFPRGKSFTDSGVTVIIQRTPTKAPGYVDGDRWVQPVRIRFFSNQF